MRQYGFLVAAALWLAACGSARKPAEGEARPACTGCHGDSSRVAAQPIPAAPPIDTRGRSDTASPGVGAHQQHLTGTRLRGTPIACDQCHPVPEDTQHAALPLQFSWGKLATGEQNSPTNAARVQPRFDENKLTCSNYCHGATLSGGLMTAPIWNQVGAGLADCGTCHGVPPPEPHPLVPAGAKGCRDCHARTVDETGALVLAGDATAHMNGKIDFAGSGGDCTGCHGDPARTTYDKRAPPRDTKGNVVETAPGVGAHRSHLAGGPIRAGVACQECHGQLPTDLQHAEQPLHLEWGPLASLNGTVAVGPKDGTTFTLNCTNYCHGATLGGGSNTNPTWNVVDGSQMACGTCHGLPPPYPHPPRSRAAQCSDCHGTTVNTDGTINVAGGLHVNGRLDFGGTGGNCTGCHGDPARPQVDLQPAPPQDVAGDTATTAPGVGAHQQHLLAGPIAGPVLCEECHGPKPTDLGHINKVVALPFPGRARAGAVGAQNPAAATATFDSGTLRCSNYCHGQTLAGGSNKTPVWNRVGAGEAACGTCHGVPPTPPHPASSTCQDCHSGTFDGSAIRIADGLHINGKIDFGGSGGDCGGCHGDSSRTDGDKAAPPRDTRGNTDTSAPGVGAHQAHVRGSAIAPPFGCNACHDEPRPADLSHVDGDLKLNFPGLARSSAPGALNPSPANPTFDRTTLQCSNYCHGQTLAGGRNRTPTWNRVNAGEADCGTCHGVPPPAPAHPPATLSTCVDCHQPTVDASGTVNTATHLNGKLDFGGSGGNCTGCHGDPNRTSGDLAAPPRDAHGNVATSAPGVGAHQAHLQGSDIAPGFGCTACHGSRPTDLSHIDGNPNLTFPGLARSGAVGAQNPSAASPSFSGTTCSNYCHGQTLNGGSNNTPTWTSVGQGQAACGTCHGIPPGGRHPATAPGDRTTCARCHSGTVRADGSIDVGGGLHLNGRIDFSGSGSCSGCHGDPNRTVGDKAAPPVDLSGSSSPSSPGVGAHLQHIQPGPLAGAFSCLECHGDYPTDLSHINGDVNLTFDRLARSGAAGALDPSPANPTFDALRCSNYCHGQTLRGGSNKTPLWTGVGQGQAACGTCHGVPPPSPHPPASRCNDCHAGTVDANGAIVPGGLHLNGRIDFSGLGGSCTGCHGDPNNPGDPRAPPRDTKGNTSTSAPGVGAHQSHLGGGPISGGVACSECHPVPGDISHANAPVQFQWGPIATDHGAVTPSFNDANPNAPTCTNYCHGATLGGGTNKTPIWNRVDGSQMACGTCHGLPPTTNHPPVGGGGDTTICRSCHSGTVDATGKIITSSGKHINGVADVCFASNPCP